MSVLGKFVKTAVWFAARRRDISRRMKSEDQPLPL
jgi:hypothetical protein